MYEELNKKLAEWAGFRDAHEGTDKVGISYWSPHIDGISFKASLMDFTESLDTIFRWLVPNLREMGCTVCLDILLESTLATIVYQAKMYEANEEIPTLALCLAIEKLIDKEEK